jgi:hypothetical protein
MREELQSSTGDGTAAASFGRLAAAIFKQQPGRPFMRLERIVKRGEILKRAVVAPIIGGGGGGGVPPGPSYDSDAAAYMAAVEAVDTQSLEVGVKTAINNFVVGCKADGIFTAIQACCILAGARTRLGALVPLVGTAPTSFNFVDGDYNRKTGLIGNTTNKYLDSNRAANAEPQDSAHVFARVTTADSRVPGVQDMNYIGAANAGFTSRIGFGPYGANIWLSNRSGAATSGASSATGGIGVSRSASTGYDIRREGANATRTVTSVTPGATNIVVFAQNANGTINSWSNARISFYSIGTAINLEQLDNRVATLMSEIDAAII